jgi:hypothetical protein
MENLPAYISFVFILTTLLSLLFLLKATNSSKKVLVVLSLWLLIQGIIAASGFYTITDSFPPRILFIILPPVLFIVILFATSRGQQFLDKLDIKTLTLLHLVRVPVEFVLLMLSIYKVVPELITFEGRNFDILSGLSAPVIYYFGFVKNRLSTNVVLGWNFLCLALLMNVVINAMLAAPTPLQKFAFDQPNIAVMYFPFVWLPCFVVPVVLFSHLVSIRQLLAGRKPSMVINGPLIHK